LHKYIYMIDLMESFDLIDDLQNHIKDSRHFPYKSILLFMLEHHQSFNLDFFDLFTKHDKEHGKLVKDKEVLLDMLFTPCFEDYDVSKRLSYRKEDEFEVNFLDELYNQKSCELNNIPFIVLNSSYMSEKMEQYFRTYMNLMFPKVLDYENSYESIGFISEIDFNNFIKALIKHNVDVVDDFIPEIVAYTIYLSHTQFVYSDDFFDLNVSISDVSNDDLTIIVNNGIQWLLNRKHPIEALKVFKHARHLISDYDDFTIDRICQTYVHMDRLDLETLDLLKQRLIDFWNAYESRLPMNETELRTKLLSIINNTIGAIRKVESMDLQFESDVEFWESVYANKNYKEIVSYDYSTLDLKALITSVLMTQRVLGQLIDFESWGEHRTFADLTNRTDKVRYENFTLPEKVEETFFDLNKEMELVYETTNIDEKKLYSDDEFESRHKFTFPERDDSFWVNMVIASRVTEILDAMKLIDTHINALKTH